MKKYGNTFFLLVENGKKTLIQKEAYKKYMDNLKDGHYVISIIKRNKKRTLQQNAYYWAILTFVCSEIGVDLATKLHDSFKVKFLLEGINKKLPDLKSTTELSTQEMSEYMEKVFRYIEDPDEGLGIRIPSPEEAWIQQEMEKFIY